MKLLHFVFVCFASAMLLGGCDEEETFVTENQIKFVQAEYIDSNTFKIIYKAPEHNVTKIQK